MKWNKKHRLKYILILPLLFVSLIGSSQQVPIYTMQQFVRPGINPAYTGLEETYDLVLLTRQQWVGIPGSPRSYYLASNVPLHKRKAGVGFVVQNQSSGPYRQSGIFFNYSYKINISEMSTLSFGLRGGMNTYRINVSDLRVIDQGDYLFQNDVENLLLPNFGVGLHYTIRNYYVDFSIPMLLRNAFSHDKQDKASSQNREDRTINIQAGSSFKIMEGFALHPALAVWLTSGSPPLIDIRLSATIQDAVGFGLAYRVSGSFGGYFTYRILDNFILGYAYELPLAYDYHLSSGTHEVVLGLDFQLFKKKTLSPRRF